LFFNASDLLSRGFALLPIQLRGFRPRQPSMSAVHDRGHHLQIAQQLGACAWGRFRFLPLRLEKQIRRI
jgi:hypothetical protein